MTVTPTSPSEVVPPPPWPAMIPLEPSVMSGTTPEMCHDEEPLRRPLASPTRAPSSLIPLSVSSSSRLLLSVWPSAAPSPPRGTKRLLDIGRGDSGYSRSGDHLLLAECSVNPLFNVTDEW